MNAIQCDNCQTVVNPDTSVGWRRLESLGIDVRVIGESPGPWHFDSLKCLVEWALAFAGVKEDT